MSSVVQQASAFSGSATTLDAVFGSNVTAGNTIVVLVKCGGNFTPSGTVTASGYTFNLDWDASDGNAGVNAIADHAVFSATVPSTAALTVNFASGIAANRLAIVAYECTPLAAHNGTARAIARFTNSANPSSGNITPGAATGLMFAFISAAQSNTWEADFANHVTTDTSNGRFHTGVDTAPTVAAQAADATLGGSAFWDCGVIWYAEASGGGASKVPCMLNQYRRRRQ